MRIAHISDTHLGYRQYNLDEREQDIYDAFDEAISKIIEERVDVLIHSGDLFDSPNPQIKALKSFKNSIEKLEGKVKIFSVLGDHDMPKRRGIPPHKLFNVNVLGIGRLQSEEYKGVLFSGISNLKGNNIILLKEELKKFDHEAEKYKKSVLILHQALKKYLPFEGAYELTADDLPRSATYYALGHIHSRLFTKFGSGKLAYAGSTEILRKDEISSWEKNGKGFYIIDLEDDEVAINKIDLDIRPQINIDINTDELEEISDKLNYGKKPILHARVIGEHIDMKAIIEKFNELYRNKTLSIKLSFKDTSSKMNLIPQKDWNLKKLMSEYLNDEILADLAYNLYQLLIDNNIEEAKKVAEKFLEENKNDL
ncbi:MAG: metallophosphoesterase [Candidatus Helarchaeota archaeon]